VKPAISHHEDQQPCHRDHLLGDLWEACECQEGKKRFFFQDGVRKNRFEERQEGDDGNGVDQKFSFSK
jgi:hypothetical protein